MTRMMHAPIRALIGLVMYAAPLPAESPLALTGGWDIKAGAVEWNSGPVPEISGEFRVEQPSTGFDSGMETPRGGACLMANLVPFGIGLAKCSTHIDYNGPDAIDKQHDPGLADYHGYCISRDGSGEEPSCWTQPGPPGSYCKRSIDGWEMAEGVHKLGPVNGDPLNNGTPYPEWAVYACMAHLGHDKACGEPLNPNRLVSFSPLSAQ